jgi:hypothetical protein
MQRSGDRGIGKSGNRTLWVAILSALLTFGTRMAWAQALPPQQTNAASAVSPAPVGIPRDLARLRTQQLKDVRYQLSCTITPKADSITGHEELRFVQNADDLHPSKPKPGSPGAPVTQGRLGADMGQTHANLGCSGIHREGWEAP